MTSFPELWNALAADFDPYWIKERPGPKGRVLTYVTARTVMNRLDAVVGFESWEDEYIRDPMGSDNIVCRLTITLPDGRRITKSDAGSPGATGDDNEDDKGAFSDAFKRAAVKFGVGRSLYGDGCYLVPKPKRAALPAPATGPEPEPEPGPAPGPTAAATPSGNGVPKTGKHLLNWIKARESDAPEMNEGLGRRLMAWGIDREYPDRFIDWEPWQVVEGYGEATQLLGEMEDAYHATVSGR